MPPVAIRLFGMRGCIETDSSAILSGPGETLETHLTVFAAERARREGRGISLDKELG